MTPAFGKQEMIAWIEENRDVFTQMSDDIWDHPETKWQEFFASRLQMDYLKKVGFSIDSIGEMNTAFAASWGSGKPVLGFLGEFDALPGLSQKDQCSKEPIEEGAPGHGCGHNLLGTGCLASAVAVKEWLAANGKEGTVVYYGCPAEEGGGGKTFMARAGAFDRLDAALNYHPVAINFPSVGSNVGVNHLRFRFTGKAAHAGGAPHLGRSALDAIELMNVGVNYLREHVTDDVRLHYIITDGGKAPNIVPEKAESWYYVRAHDPDNLSEVTERVRDIARGAALMTRTQMEEEFESAYTRLLNNRYLANLHYEAMKLIGPIEYTDEEYAYAQAINDAYGVSNSQAVDGMLDHFKPDESLVQIFEKYRDKPLIGENFPPLDSGKIGTGSTDVGDVSWIAPLCLLRIACWSTGSSSHDWGVVATGRMSIGHKGMLHAAKIMAAVAVDLFDDPHHMKMTREEFEKAISKQPYKNPIPDYVEPPIQEPES